VTYSKKRQIAYLVFFVVLLTAGFAFLGNASSHQGVLKAAAQASPTAATPVENDLTVTTKSITLGSTIGATGNVRTADGPLAGATVELHLGDIVLARTQTDANGNYAFSVPVGMYYVPAAAVGGATVYTLVQPLNASFVTTASGVTDVPVDAVPLYLAIAVLTGAIVIILYFYVRRMYGERFFGPLRRKRAKLWAGKSVPLLRRIYDRASLGLPKRAKPSSGLPKRAKPAAAQQSIEPSVPHSAATTELPQLSNYLEHVDERGTINELFDAAVNDLVATHEVAMPARATHWEKYYAIEAAVPEVKAAMHTLTVAWCTNYKGKRLNNRQRDAVIEAFRTIQAHVKSVKGSVRAEPPTAS
jgi:hypothetical protein